MTDLSGRNISYSVMRVFSCMAIVLMHTLNISEILYRDDISDIERRLSLTSVYMLMWAVPVFIMVSGALLLDPKREITIKKIFGVYLLRVVLALFFACIVFSLFDSYMNEGTVSFSAVSEGILKALEGKSWSHLWYLYLLCGLYLLLPLYRAAVSGLDKGRYRYILLVLAVFLSLLPQLEYGGHKAGFNIQIPAVYTLYFLLGYALASGIIEIPKKAGILIFITGLVLTAVFSFAGGDSLPEYTDDHLGSYAHPVVLLQSLGFFAMVFGTDTDKKSRLIAFLDEHSFGIYLIHMIFLRLILRYMKVNPYINGIPVFIAVAAFAYAASLLVCFLLRRIPPVRRVL